MQFLVVGAGLTGATIARCLADAGQRVRVVERRSRAGGNVSDEISQWGIRHNLYGPHYFRTSSDRIWKFCKRFTSFYPFEAVLRTSVKGKLFRWPLHSGEMREHGFDSAPPQPASDAARSFEEAMLAFVSSPAYRAFIHDYTEKQWGLPPRMLDASLAKRLEVREDGDERLSRAKYQGLPMPGFTAWVEQMLEGIDVEYGAELGACQDLADRVVFTGSIDQFFDYRFGRLPYRAQRREHLFLPMTQQALPCVQVNVPNHADASYVRMIEWRHMLAPGEADAVAGTLVTTETPIAADASSNPEYPMPTAEARSMFARYEELAAAHPSVLFCGRLGEYRYLDMDQAIGRAMVHAERLLAES